MNTTPQRPAPPCRPPEAPCPCPCHRAPARQPRCPRCCCPEPAPCGPDDRCPPPCVPVQPGTIEVDQPPPFHAPTSPTPPAAGTRPPTGGPGEVPWFQGQAGEIGRKGPTFGPRRTEYLPYLLARAAPGDRGRRPFPGVFWESPDIFVAPDQDAASAPLMPPTNAGLARANAPNTLYAHVWNLGKAPAHGVRVEFYWCNPSLGISRASGHLVGAADVDLTSRFVLHPDWRPARGPSGGYLTRGCHAIVRCPQTWVPSYENNGHECLVVRVFDPLLDALPRDEFSPVTSRKVCQRNIAVVEAASPAELDLFLDLGYVRQPGTADLGYTVDAPESMDWLRLLLGGARAAYATGTGPVAAGFLPPTVGGARPPGARCLPPECRPAILRPAVRFERRCDPVSVLFHAGVADLEAGQVNVVRVTQRIDGELTGGYTVVLLRRAAGRPV